MKNLFICCKYFEYFIFLIFILSLQLIETDSYVKNGNGYNNTRTKYSGNKYKGKQYDLCFLFSLPLLLFIFFLKYLYFRIVYNEI